MTEGALTLTAQHSPGEHAGNSVPAEELLQAGAHYYTGILDWAASHYGLAHRAPLEADPLFHGFVSDELLALKAGEYFNSLVQNVIRDTKTAPRSHAIESRQTSAQIRKYACKVEELRLKFFTIETPAIDPDAGSFAPLSTIGSSAGGVLCFLRADFSGKSMKSPAALAQVHSGITELLLARNSLVESDFLGRFCALTQLHFSHNLLLSLPSTPLNCLLFADFSSNQISAEFCLRAPQLQRLSLAHNLLDGSGSWSLAALKMLDISHNRLKKLDFVKNLPALAELYAAHNQVDSLEGLSDHPSIEVAHLRGNRIIEVPLLTCAQLRVLNLRQNAITDARHLLLALQSGSLPGLASLSLLENEGWESDAETARAFLSAGALKRLDKKTLAELDS